MWELLAAAATGVFNWISGSRQQRRQNAANMKMAEYQNQKNIEFWQMNNEYNTPQMQKMRLEEAGLNPNLVYGNGSVQNTAQPIAKAERPEQGVYRPQVDIMNVLGYIQDLKQKQAQTDLIKAQTDNVHQKTINEGILTGIREVGLASDKFRYERDRQTAEYTLEGLELKNRQTREAITNLLEKTNLTKEQKKLVTAQIAKVWKENQYMDFKNSMRDFGIVESDNLLFRTLAVWAKKLGLSDKLGLILPSLD